MASYFGPDFDRVVGWAKQFVPFRLRTKSGLKDDDGDELNGITYAHTNGQFTIWIDRNQTHDSAVDALLHELSHCTDHLKRGLTGDFYKDHGPSFDREHGKWTRAFWRWNDGSESQR